MIKKNHICVYTYLTVAILIIEESRKVSIHPVRYRPIDFIRNEKFFQFGRSLPSNQEDSFRSSSICNEQWNALQPICDTSTLSLFLGASNCYIFVVPKIAWIDLQCLLSVPIEVVYFSFCHCAKKKAREREEHKCAEQLVNRRLRSNRAIISCSRPVHSESTRIESKIVHRTFHPLRQCCRMSIKRRRLKVWCHAEWDAVGRILR